MKTLRAILADRYRKGAMGRDTVTGWDFTKDERLRPMRAMRAKCMECQNGQQAEVRECRMTDCTLWLYRMGRSTSVDPSYVNLSEETDHR